MDETRRARINAIRAKTLQRLENGPIQQEVDVAMKNHDFDLSGDLDAQEVKTLLDKMAREYAEECELNDLTTLTQDFWVHYDTNKDHKISKDELYNFIHSYHKLVLAPL